VPAEIVIICCWAVCLGIMAFIYVWSRRQNTLKAKIRAQPDYTKLENQVGMIPSRVVLVRWMCSLTRCRNSWI